MTKKHIITMTVALFLLCMITSFAFAQTKGHVIRYKRGNVNSDDVVNTGDASLILRYCAEPKMVDFSALQTLLADANDSGEVNTGDATYVLRITVGMNAQLYYEEYVKDYYNLTFDTGNGEVVNQPDEPIILLEDTNILPYLVGDNSVKAKCEGFDFIGWSIDDVLIDENADEILIKHDITAVAVYKKVENAHVTIHYYDCFNEVDVGDIDQTILFNNPVLNSENIKLPNGYKLDSASYQQNFVVDGNIATPNPITVEVYPYTMIDDREFKIIYTVTGFMKIQQGLTLNYLLGNDIDLAEVGNMMPFGWNWDDTTQADTPYTGIFDGNGCTVTNLYIDYIISWISEEEYRFNSNVGLFAINEGLIRNLTVYTKAYAGDDSYGVFGDVNVGVIAGRNHTVISNCHAFGNVGSFDYVEEARGAVGGVVGTNSNGALIEKCSFEGGVEGFYYLGGISGKNFGNIDQCYFAGGLNYLMEAQFAYDYNVCYVGGIVGGSQAGTISNSYVNLTGDACANCAIGGIAGWIKGGSLKNDFVVHPERILFVSDYGGVYVGYDVDGTYTSSGLYNMAETSGMPQGYDNAIWDMNGASDTATIPDLIKNRRGKEFFVSPLV